MLEFIPTLWWYSRTVQMLGLNLKCHRVTIRSWFVSMSLSQKTPCSLWIYLVIDETQSQMKHQYIMWYIYFISKMTGCFWFRTQFLRRPEGMWSLSLILLPACPWAQMVSGFIAGNKSKKVNSRLWHTNSKTDIFPLANKQSSTRRMSKYGHAQSSSGSPVWHRNLARWQVWAMRVQPGPEF